MFAGTSSHEPVSIHMRQSRWPVTQAMPALHGCSTEQRIQLLLQGLSDHEPGVNSATLDLLGHWLSLHCSGNMVQLLELFNPVAHPGEESAKIWDVKGGVH